MASGGNLRQGLLAGPVFGAFIGLADCIWAAVEGGTVLTPRHWLGAVVAYAAIWVLPGLAAGFAGGLFPRRARASVLLVAIGSVAFVAGAYANVVLLPSFTAPASLRFDGILLGAGALTFALLYRLPIPVPEPRARVWLASGALPFLAALVAGLVAGSEPVQRVEVSAAEGPRPGVVVVLADSLRADHLHAYGYDRETSPRFDALAKGGALFTQFRAASTWTKPATASLLTGLLPTAHGAVEHREVLGPGAVTLAEVFRSVGYRTAAFSDNPFVAPEFGFGQGFDLFDSLGSSPFVNGTLLGKALWTARVLSMDGRPFGPRLPEIRGTPELAHRLLDWLDRTDGSRPFFAYVHAMEPHVPYDPPAPFRGTFADPLYRGPDHRRPPPYQGFLPFETAPALPPAELRHLVDRYDEEILAFDAGLSAILDGLSARGLLADTLVVVLADHGEEFHEHGGWTHGQSLFEELVRVPFLIAGPGIAAGERPWPARATDLLPTLLSLAGLAAETPLFGIDLAETVRGGVPPLAAPVVSEVRFGGAGATSVVWEGMKYVVAHRGSEERRLLFDLAVDPGEQTPLADPARAAGLAESLAKVLRAAGAMALRSRSRKLSEAEDEAFRGFGYGR
jgi:arylsulfatase A-like enzyme